MGLHGSAPGVHPRGPNHLWLSHWRPGQLLYEDPPQASTPFVSFAHASDRVTVRASASMGSRLRLGP